MAPHAVAGLGRLSQAASCARTCAQRFSVRRSSTLGVQSRTNGGSTVRVESGRRLTGGARELATLVGGGPFPRGSRKAMAAVLRARGRGRRLDRDEHAPARGPREAAPMVRGAEMELN